MGGSKTRVWVNPTILMKLLPLQSGYDIIKGPPPIKIKNALFPVLHNYQVNFTTTVGG